MNGELDVLCKLIREEKVILWVGSGFSSYAGYPTGTELPSMLLSSLGELPEGAPDPETASLQEAADYYVEQKERSGLNTFLVEQYGKEPSRCDMHDSLALINRVKYIVTTNYDPLFERAYGDRVVVVSRDEDLPKSTEYPDKTILMKIHGGITQPDTIVITSEDYKNFDADTIVWSKIRTLLAEYSVVFIGYSLHDPNVETMLQGIYTRLKGKKHPYFFISRTVDATKRKDLADHDLHFIEMDAISAIDYITGNAVQYSYLDGMKNPPLFSRSAKIFEKYGVRVDRTFAGEKVSNISLIPTRPDVHCEFNLTISSKTGDNTKILEFCKFASGQSFESVNLTDADCNISIKDAKMNGIYIFDPSIQSFPAISVSSQPGEIVSADLQLQNASLRLSNLKFKIFKSDVLLKLEIDDPDFFFKLSIPKEKPEWTLNFSLHHIMSDIERGRLIYNLFNSWMQGETLELLTDRLPIPFLIPPISSPEISPDSPPIPALCKLYTDLSDIQHILKVRLSVPATISREDLQTIRDLATFLHGRKQKIPEVKATIVLRTDDITPLTEGKLLTLEGKGPVGTLDYSIFGKTLKVPFTIEGLDILFENVDDILDLIKKEVKELPIVAKSTTGQLFIHYSPLQEDNTLSARSA